MASSNRRSWASTTGFPGPIRPSGPKDVEAVPAALEANSDMVGSVDGDRKPRSGGDIAPRRGRIYDNISYRVIPVDLITKVFPTSAALAGSVSNNGSSHQMAENSTMIQQE